MASILLLGVGNEYRRDDAIGLLVARALQAKQWPGVIIEEDDGDGAALLERWSAADTVILVDAMCAGTAPGALHTIDACRQPIPASFLPASTHAFGVAQAIELARILDCLPPHLLFYGIEGKDFGVGQGLSPELAAILPAIIELLACQLCPCLIDQKGA
jgi:hydrogenase maturation protease